MPISVKIEIIGIIYIKYDSTTTFNIINVIYSNNFLFKLGEKKLFINKIDNNNGDVNYLRDIGDLCKNITCCYALHE